MPFTEILHTLVVSQAPAVRAAIFCDHEGEKVASENGHLTAFDVDVLGASLALAAGQMQRGAQLRVVFGNQVVWLIVVDLGCYLCVVCAPGQDFSCRHVFPRVAEALITHM